MHYYLLVLILKGIEDGRTVPGVRGNGSVSLSHSGNVVTRIGIHKHLKGIRPVLARSSKCTTQMVTNEIQRITELTNVSSPIKLD